MYELYSLLQENGLDLFITIISIFSKQQNYVAMIILEFYTIFNWNF